MVHGPRRGPDRRTHRCECHWDFIAEGYALKAVIGAKLACPSQSIDGWSDFILTTLDGKITVRHHSDSQAAVKVATAVPAAR